MSAEHNYRSAQCCGTCANAKIDEDDDDGRYVMCSLIPVRHIAMVPWCQLTPDEQDWMRQAYDRVALVTTDMSIEKQFVLDQMRRSGQYCQSAWADITHVCDRYRKGME